jgi:hypothetical protein
MTCGVKALIEVRLDLDISDVIHITSRNIRFIKLLALLGRESIKYQRKSQMENKLLLY